MAVLCSTGNLHHGGAGILYLVRHIDPPRAMAFGTLSLMSPRLDAVLAAVLWLPMTVTAIPLVAKDFLLAPTGDLRLDKDRPVATVHIRTQTHTQFANSCRLETSDTTLD
jgi:hypothetical protein